MKVTTFSGLKRSLFLILYLSILFPTMGQNTIHDTWEVSINGKRNTLTIKQEGKKNKTKIYVNDESRARFTAKVKGVYYVGGDPLWGMDEDDDFRITYNETKRTLTILNGEGKFVALAKRKVKAQKVPKNPMVELFGSTFINLTKVGASNSPFVVTVYQRNNEIKAIWGDLDDFDTLKAKILLKQLIVYKKGSGAVFATLKPEGSYFQVNMSSGNSFKLKETLGELGDIYDAEDLYNSSLGTWIVPNNENPGFSLTVSGKQSNFKINWKSDNQENILQGRLNRNASTIIGFHEGKKQITLVPQSSKLNVTLQDGSSFYLVKKGEKGTSSGLFSNPTVSKSPLSTTIPQQPITVTKQGNDAAGVWYVMRNGKQFHVIIRSIENQVWWLESRGADPSDIRNHQWANSSPNDFTIKKYDYDRSYSGGQKLNLQRYVYDKRTDQIQVYWNGKKQFILRRNNSYEDVPKSSDNQIIGKWNSLNVERFQVEISKTPNGDFHTYYWDYGAGAGRMTDCPANGNSSEIISETCGKNSKYRYSYSSKYDLLIAVPLSGRYVGQIDKIILSRR
ncbi:MAG: hypothetical protein AAFY71_18435 [Bacteroidota bacterium]